MQIFSCPFLQRLQQKTLRILFCNCNTLEYASVETAKNAAYELFRLFGAIKKIHLIKFLNQYKRNNATTGNTWLNNV